MTTVRYTVTVYLTHRGTVAASTVPALFNRAVRNAIKAHPGRQWSSMVCVLLERIPANTVEVGAGDPISDIVEEP